MYREALQQAGLSKEEAEIYEILLTNGRVPARKIFAESSLKRGLVYKTLERLMEHGLAEKHDKKGAVAEFEPKHPLLLQEQAEQKKKYAQNAISALGGIMEQLTASFNLATGQPGVRFFSGIEGLREIYQDILETGKDFYLIRPRHEPVYKKKIEPAVLDFIKRRIKKNMHVIALTPMDERYKERNALKEQDKKMLFHRTWVPLDTYQAHVEIDIYGNKVAFLSFGKELIGTIIESPQIAEAMTQLFQVIQDTSRATHKPDAGERARDTS